MTTTSPTMTERIETLSGRLQKYAARHATPTCTADDLHQTAVEAILSSCSPEDNDTYMLRMADWRMKNLASRERVYSARVLEVDLEADEDDDEGGLVIADLTDSPEEAVMRRETVRNLQAVAGRLKPDQLTIIQMMADGMNQSEIARALNTSSNLVNYHVGRIRLVLQNAGMTPALAMG